MAPKKWNELSEEERVAVVEFGVPAELFGDELTPNQAKEVESLRPFLRLGLLAHCERDYEAAAKRAEKERKCLVAVQAISSLLEVTDGE